MHNNWRGGGGKWGTRNKGRESGKNIIFSLLFRAYVPLTSKQLLHQLPVERCRVHYGSTGGKMCNTPVPKPVLTL